MHTYTATSLNSTNSAQSPSEMYLEESPSGLGRVGLLCLTGPWFLSLQYKANIID